MSSVPRSTMLAVRKMWVSGFQEMPRGTKYAAQITTSSSKSPAVLGGLRLRPRSPADVARRRSRANSGAWMSFVVVATGRPFRRLALFLGAAGAPRSGRHYRLGLRSPQVYLPGWAEIGKLAHLAERPARLGHRPPMIDEQMRIVHPVPLWQQRHQVLLHADRVVARRLAEALSHASHVRIDDYAFDDAIGVAHHDVGGLARDAGQ